MNLLLLASYTVFSKQQGAYICRAWFFNSAMLCDLPHSATALRTGYIFNETQGFIFLGILLHRNVFEANILYIQMQWIFHVHSACNLKWQHEDRLKGHMNLLLLALLTSGCQTKTDFTFLFIFMYLYKRQ